MSLEWLLKSFAEEDKTKGLDLTGILQRKRLRLHRQKKSREASLNFSPYNVGYGFCMREKVAQLAEYHTILIKQPTPKEQLMFDVGKKFHDILQGYFWKCGILEGLWKCRCCDIETYGISPSKQCSFCKKYTIEYKEVPLTDEKYMIRGRADGILHIEVDNIEQRHLVDIKSISNKGAQHSPLDPRLYFEDLDKSGPNTLHVVQLNLYMMMSKIADAHLLYVAKSDHRMKSFHIKYNEQLLQPFLDSILEAIEWSKEMKLGKRKDLPAPCNRKKCMCQDIIVKNKENE